MDTMKPPAQGAGLEVSRLHMLLAAHGLPVPAAELQQRVSGQGTRAAVLEFQRRRGLPRTGVADAATAAALASPPEAAPALSRPAAAAHPPAAPGERGRAAAKPRASARISKAAAAAASRPAAPAGAPPVPPASPPGVRAESTAFPIEIDARQLFGNGFIVPQKPGQLDSKTVQTLQLEPGKYNIQFAGGYYADFEFSVTSDGLLDYGSDFDNFLAGRGTSRLTLNGLQVTVDASRLSGAGVLLLVIGSDWLSKPTSIRLLPGSFYMVQQGSGEVVSFNFKLGPDGNWSYSPELDIQKGGCLSGNGTPSLTFVGFTIQVDVTAVPRDVGGLSIWPIWGMGFQEGRKLFANLLPAPAFSVLSSDATLNDLAFSIDNAGNVTFDAALSSRLSVQKQPDGSVLLRVSDPSASTGSVQGKLVFDYGLPAALVTVRLYNIGFAGQETQLGETRSDNDGNYAISYAVTTGTARNLQMRALDPGNKEVGISHTKFGAQQQETMNLVVPESVRPLAPEFQRLSADLDRLIGGIGNLAQVQENQDRQDLTLLHGRSGWDARLLAFAALATGLSAPTGLTPEVLYALLRVGFPANPRTLALVDASAFRDALLKANEGGIVNLSGDQVTAAVSAFQGFSAKFRLDLKASGANSTYGDLLSRSGLSPEQQAAFADLFFSEPEGGDNLWQKAAEAGIPPNLLDALKLQGKLAQLTLNNAELTSKLQQDLGSLDNLSGLVQKDLYTAAAWKSYISAVAASPDALDKLIPLAYGGASTEERLDSYADDLAQKVRISFPTRVAARMVAKAELPMAQKDNVAAFLGNAAALGFELGSTPLNRFISKNGSEAFQGIPAAQVAATSDEVKTLRRLYQIAPSNESLQTVMQLGFKSAREVASFTPQRFVESFGSRFPSVAEAERLHANAQQVTAVALNAFAAMSYFSSTPTIAALSPSPEVQAAVKSSLIEHFPTMESLLGSLDFCECRDCRSVLSPAAYLVDLLKFLDPDVADWNNFLTHWRNEHGGAGYEDTHLKPYDALVSRRPDLAYLPLTCENTNTVLPYIDIVNEIIEYYIAHGSLDQNAAYDTGAAQSEDLLAEPRNVLPAAYSALNGARYPLGLPFDLWLETVRGLLDYLKLPLPTVLDLFRAADPLELFTDGNRYPYYLSAILAEELRISPAEYALLTDAGIAADWVRLYYPDYAAAPLPDQATALASLKSAKTLSQRLDISYQELVGLVSTSFINPQLKVLVTLRKLGLLVEDVFSYEGQPGFPPISRDLFEKALDSLTDRYNPQHDPNGFNARSWLDTTWKSGAFNQVLILSAPAVGCDFAATNLQYASGQPAEWLVFAKLNLFVRIWKKLGWTMEETDRALESFLSPLLPPLSDPAFGAKFTAAMKSALVYLAQLRRLAARLQPDPYGLIGILPIWSNIPTDGLLPLYARLFLDPAVLQNDPVFDDPTGNYLSAPPLLQDHLPAVQGALGLSFRDVVTILAEGGVDPATARLSLDNLSRLYRWTMLARGLQLPVGDLVAVKEISGLDPFPALSPTPLTVLANDLPLTGTLALVDAVEKVKETVFDIEELQYLLRHQFDPVGPYKTDEGALLQLVRTVAARIAAIEAQNQIPADPLAFTDAAISQKLALIFPADVVQTFMGMWTGAIQYSVERSGVSPAQQLDPATLSAFPAVKVSYDVVLGSQRLVYQGVLLDPQRQAIEAANNSPLLASLLDEVQGKAFRFYQDYLQISAIGPQPVGFLPPADFGVLFAPATPGGSDAPRRQELAQNLLPYLRGKLVRRAVTEALAADLGADPSMTAALLGNAAILSDPSSPGSDLANAFLLAGVRGVTVAYFASGDGTGAPVGSGTAVSVDTADAAIPQPAATKSATFQGYLEVPAGGPYRFFAHIGKAQAGVDLRLDILSGSLLLGTTASDGAEMSEVVELQGGVPYHFTLKVTNSGGGDIRLLVQGESLPKGGLERLTLYPETAVGAFRRGRILLSKTLRLITGFRLNQNEVRYLAGNGSDFNDLSFSALPTRLEDDSPAKAAALFGQFLRLAGYCALRAEVAGGGDGLIAVFRNARRSFLATAAPAESTAAVLQGLYQLLADLTRRDVKTVQAAAVQLGFGARSQLSGGQLLVQASDFTQEKGLGRLWDVLQAVQATGLSVPALAAATGMVDAAKGQDERAALADSIRNGVKAHYPPETWRAVAQGIFDKLRQQKRDTLSAYCVNKLGLENAEQLFEFFLVDPGMEPVVRTSRIRLALSSVQTFVQRCLLNLEPRVSPAAIDSVTWEWMKRYRVWEANRRVFLWPENWMEPELRTDKSDLFKAAESALLQGDVTNDLAEEVLRDYLKGLQERARLEMVSMHLEEVPGHPESNVVHVLGRNYGTPRKYFYRTYAFGSWSAWEPVTVEIEGDHVAVVVWKGRLHIFWLTFAFTHEAAIPSPLPAGLSGQPVASMDLNDLAHTVGTTMAPRKQVKVQLNWSENFQGKWTDRRASDMSKVVPIDVGADFEPHMWDLNVFKESEDGAEGPVNIIFGRVQAFRLRGINNDPELIFASRFGKFPWPEWSISSATILEFPDKYYTFTSRSFDSNKINDFGPLQDTYYEFYRVDFFTTALDTNHEIILWETRDYSVLLTNAPILTAYYWTSDYAVLQSQATLLSRPFFYEDRSSSTTFFVQPELKEISIQSQPGWAVNVVNPATSTVAAAPLSVRSQVPSIAGSFTADPASIFTLQPRTDWVTAPGASISFGASQIGPGGATASAIPPFPVGLRTVTLAQGRPVDETKE